MRISEPACREPTNGTQPFELDLRQDHVYRVRFLWRLAL